MEKNCLRYLTSVSFGVLLLAAVPALGGEAAAPAATIDGAAISYDELEKLIGARMRR